MATESQRKMASRIEIWETGTLVPYKKNSRTHSADQVQQIVASIEQFGFTNPILVDENRGIIAGHGRLLAAQKMGMKKVPVVPLTHLTPAQKRAYVIADNKLALNAGWDEEVLSAELSELKSDDFDISTIGFSDEELGELLDVDKPDNSENDDVVPDQVEAVTKLGDMWLLGDHRVLCGDCADKSNIDKLMNGEKADMVFTDPPYGMNLDTDYSKLSDRKGNKGTKFRPVIGDAKEFDPSHILEIDVPETFLFGCDYYAKYLPNGGSWVVWDKRSNDNAIGSLDGSFGSDFELCWSKQKHQRLIARRMRQVGAFLRPGHEDTTVHPTQKPVSLVEWFFERWGKEATVIWDGYLGSGSTLIACEKTGRKCYGMEIDPHYCDVIVKRWEDYTGKKAELEKA